MGTIGVEEVETRLGGAERCVARERERTIAERKALEAFEAKLRELWGRTHAIQQSPPVGAVAVPSDGQLRSIRDAYESTVMAVDHYEEEYGDTYAESLAAEYSPEISAALTRGTTFDDRCRRAVVSANRAAQERRTAFLGLLETEASAIESASDTLSSIADELATLEKNVESERNFGALDAYYMPPERARARLRGTLAERQAALVEQRRSLMRSVRGPDIPSYLYSELPVRHPIVSTAAELLTETDRVERSIAFSH